MKEHLLDFDALANGPIVALDGLLKQKTNGYAGVFDEDTAMEENLAG